MEAPRHWIEALVAAMRDELSGKTVEGIVGGPLWLSLKIEDQFAWLIAQPPLRLAWIDPRPARREWMQLLGRHGRSPFAEHLRGARIRGVVALRDEGESLDGLSIELENGALSIRWHPRPGALWLVDASSEPIAQQGRMEGDALEAHAPGGPGLDLLAHADAARAALGAELEQRLRRRLIQEIGQRAKRERRRRIKLVAELERAERGLTLRAAGDALAARLHELRPGLAEIELEDFEGQAHRLELDPALPPAANLDRIYKRAAKAERSVAQLRERIDALEEIDADRWRARIEAEPDLDALLARAEALGIDPAPREKITPQRQKRDAAPRLPYRRFVLASGLELRVGKSARDNDELLRAHAAGNDLWLHAQAVEGSHVIVRSGGRPVPKPELALAARLAAHFSKARHSQLVPVLVTERRHVRKPRKAKPGSVVPERTETLFVEPLPPDELPTGEN